MPTGLTATAGNERAVLAWTDGDGGSPVTRHQYRYSTDGGGWSRWTNIPMTAPHEMKAAGYMLTGLTNGTSYTFEVRAVNAEGESPASNEATVTPCVCGATPTSLELSGATLSPVFASGTTSYVALVENSVTQVAVTAAAADAETATVEFLDTDDAEITDADDQTGVLDVALDTGVNTVKVKVTADDGSTVQSYVVVVFRAVLADATVPADWSLVPSGLGPGDRFRLLFVSGVKRNARSSDINAYNTWIHKQVAAGHADIQDYSDLFRAVASTEDTDARDNTATVFVAGQLGVPIYWLGDDKAADHY